MEPYVWNFLGMGISLGFMLDRLTEKRWIWAGIYGYCFLLNLIGVIMQVR